MFRSPDNKKVRVLFVLPSMQYGGAERQVIDLINGIRRDIFDISIAVLRDDFTLSKSINNPSLRVYKCFRRFKCDVGAAVRIAEIIEKERINLVHCTLQIAYLYGFLGSLIARRKVRLINALHYTIPRDRKHKLFEIFVYSQLMRFSDRTIAVSHNQRLYWIEKYPFLSTKFTVIHNGVDVRAFRDRMSIRSKDELRKKLNLNVGDFVVAMVAALRPEKGHEYAIRAMQMILRSNKRVKLLVIGDGERLSYLKQLSERLGVSRNVIWVGFQYDVKRYLSVIDMLLIASEAVETMSIAMLEALAMNKPVVATDIGGASEVIKPGFNGYLVMPRHPELISDICLRLARYRPTMRMLSENARDSVIAKFTRERMIRETENLMLDVVHNEYTN